MTAIAAPLLQAILQDRKIGYAITDPTLNIVKIGLPLASAGLDAACLGQSLLRLTPELIGSEEALFDILAGRLPRLELSWVNRESSAEYAVYVNITELPYQSADGAITGLIHILEDVTAIGHIEQRLAQQRNELRLLQRQLEHQNKTLEAANAELRRLDDLKSIFVSVAAHELRSPLTTIIGFTELLLDDPDNLQKSQQGHLQVVQNSARRLLDITNNLLDVNRLEMGRVELTLQPVDFKTLTEAVLMELSPQLQEKAQRVILVAAPDLPLALCDLTRATQILTNLISNANKYTPEGGAITLTLARAERPGFIQVAVQDNGIGIPAEDHDKLFGRFFRAQTATQTRASGAGLGLYITRALVELHNGELWFTSHVGEGSTFYFTLPVVEE